MERELIDRFGDRRADESALAARPVAYPQTSFSLRSSDDVSIDFSPVTGWQGINVYRIDGSSHRLAPSNDPTTPPACSSAPSKNRTSRNRPTNQGE